MNIKVKQILSWLLVLIWFIVIFAFSAMDSDSSNEKSIETIEKVVEKTVDTTNELGITNNIDDDKTHEISVNLNLPLRKCMHAFVYLILGILILNALRISNIKGYKIYLFSLLICFIYSLFDEYHQTFVIGRTGQLIDVFIDFSGSVLGNIIYYVIYRFKNNHKK